MAFITGKAEEHKRSEGATARDVSVAPSVFQGDIKRTGSGLDSRIKSPFRFYVEAQFHLIFSAMIVESFVETT